MTRISVRPRGEARVSDRTMVDVFATIDESLGIVTTRIDGAHRL
jgi:hypothetical protein